MRVNVVYVSLACVLLLTSGCQGVGDNNDNRDNGGLTIGITDGPIDGAREVVITFTGIEVKPVDDSAQLIDFSSPQSIDLLDYQDGKRFVLLDDYGLDPGRYNWMRLIIDDQGGASYITIDSGLTYSLTIPSGAETGLKLNRGFEIAAGNSSDFTIDFDLRKSIHEEGVGDYKLRPSLRIVDNLIATSISGTVATDLVTDIDCNSSDYSVGRLVYMYSGNGAVIQDVQNDNNGNPSDLNPIAIAPVEYESASSAYEFTFSYIVDGSYTLVFTCDGDVDDPTTDDSLIMNFSAPVDINVLDGSTGAITIM